MRKIFILLRILPLFYVFTLGAQENASSVRIRKEWRAKLNALNSKTFRNDALAGMKHPDSVIRAYALIQYFNKYKDASVPALMTLAGDADYRVASTLFGCAKAVKDHKKSMELLTMIAEKGKVPEIKRLATTLTTFRFYRNTMRLKDNPTHDHEVVIVKKIPLPLSGWKFKLDPMSDGHKKNFFAVDHNDKNWKPFRINATWESQGFKGYDGIAWYRLQFKMPPKMDHNAVELHFEAVDECAWIWLNGIYAGQHDKGTSGWKTPFWIDVTKEIKWGQVNTIAVRIQDTAGAGGIWKKAFVEILK